MNSVLKKQSSTQITVCHSNFRSQTPLNQPINLTAVDWPCRSIDQLQNLAKTAGAEQRQTLHPLTTFIFIMLQRVCGFSAVCLHFIFPSWYYLLELIFSH